ncbi:hypothetical protein J7L67_08715, partial [bacterium]|nr:hypothetical protein [bacterium]
MRKWIFLFFLTNVFLCEVLIAQTMNGNTRFKKNRKIPRDQGISSLKSRAVEFKKNNFKINFSEYRKQKRIYVKFKNSPTKAVRRKLKNFGIDLTEYLTNDTYVIKVGQNRIDKMKKLFHITGFAEIDPTDKISEQLYKQNIPTYAKDGNYVKLIVTFFNDVEFNDAISIVKSVGGIVESQSFSRTNKLKITIHPLNIRNLAEIDSVKYIETIPPPPTINNIDAGELSNVFWDNDGNTLSGLFDQDYSTNPCTTYALTGYGINVAIKDGGKIYSHSDFNGRLTIVDNDSVKLHPTHVAGTIASALSINDNDGDTGGMAERVNLYSFSYNVDGSNP